MKAKKQTPSAKQLAFRKKLETKNSKAKVKAKVEKAEQVEIPQSDEKNILEQAEKLLQKMLDIKNIIESEKKKATPSKKKEKEIVVEDDSQVDEKKFIIIDKKTKANLGEIKRLDNERTSHFRKRILDKFLIVKSVNS